MIKKNCIEIGNLKAKKIKKYFQNWAMTFLSISLSLAFLSITVIPFAHATDKITYNKNDNITNQTVINNNLTSNNIPSPNNVTITRGSEYNSVIVNWEPPTTPPSNYTYQIDLLNNISSVSRSINLNSNATSTSFNNLSTGNWEAAIYTAVNNDKSEATQSSTPVSVALSPTSTTASFNDIANLSDNFQTAIKWAASYGITAGYSDGGFHPATPTTRGQMATFFHKLAGNPATQGSPTNFSDIFKSVHRADINWLSTQGITAGYTCTGYKKPVPTCNKTGNLVYYPEGKVTRTQMATFLYRFAASPAISMNEINFYLQDFKDKNQIIANGQEVPIAWLVKNNITAGYTCTNKGKPEPECTKAGDTVFRPKYNTTRQQMVLFLQKAANTLNLNAYLKAEKTDPVTFLGMPSPNRTQITKISWQNTLPKCTNPTDVSADSRGGILACNNNNEIIIGEIGEVLANPNSSYLLANLSKSTEINIDLTNLNTIDIKNMAFMFSNSKIKSILNLPNNFGSDVTNMNSMFENTTLSTGFSFPTDFGSSITNMDYMFANSSLPKGLLLPDRFSENVENMIGVFAKASLATGFSLPDEFGNKALNITNIFADTSLPNEFSLPSGFGNRTTDMSYAFKNATLPAGFLLPAGFGREATDIANMFQNTTLPANFILPNAFGAKATNMANMLQNAKISKGFTLPNRFGQAVQNMDSMFYETTLNNDIDWSGTDLTNLTASKSNMFNKVVWNNHFIYVSNEGSRTFLITNSSISDNTKIKVKNAVNPILKTEAIDPTDFLGIPNLLRNQITKILFQNTLPNCADPKDISLDNNNSVLACVVNNTEIVIGANGFVIANDNSSYLFANLNITTGVTIDLTNLNTSTTSNMSHMFTNSKLKNISLPDDFGSVATNMINIFGSATLPTGFSLPTEFGNQTTNISYAFRNTTLPTGFSLPDKFGQIATNMIYTFQNTTLPTGFSLPNKFGQIATNMAYMCQNATIPNNFIFPAGFGSEALDINNIFASATLPTGFSLPDKFGQAATDMKWMFRYTILNGDIDWSGTDLTNLTSDKDYMFYNTTWNGHFIYVQNEGSRTFLITNSSISDNTRIQVKNAVSSTLKAEIDDPTDFLGIPGPARNQITKISFQKTIPNCSNPKDVSLDNNNSILACVVNNTEIVIGAAGTIMANDNSSWLFANLTNIAGVAIDLTNLNTSDVTNMSRMFQISILKSTPIWSNNFGVKSSNISYIFAYTTLLTNFSLPANFGSKATNMTGMFRSITLNDDIDWSNTDLSTSTATKTNMFHSVSWNNHFIYTSNENSKTFLITNSDISDNDRIQIKK